MCYGDKQEYKVSKQCDDGLKQGIVAIQSKEKRPKPRPLFLK